MLPKTKHAGTNYKAIMPFLMATDTAEGCKHFKSEGFMDLVIENLQFTDYAGRAVYSISHYSEQNGDLMSDPDMEIAVDHHTGQIVPRTFRNDFLGVYHEVFKTIDGKTCYSHRLLIDLDTFLWQWLRNIEDQGFKAA